MPITRILPRRTGTCFKSASSPICSSSLQCRRRPYSHHSPLPDPTHKDEEQTTSNSDTQNTGDDTGDAGAFSRRLAQLTEETLESGGKSARRAVEEAGFDEKLRQQLEDRIAGTNFRNKHAGAFAQVQLPAGAGKATRDIARAKPWTGVEAVEDTALRMLTDAHKPLRGSPRGPSGASRAVTPPRLGGSGQSAKTKASGSSSSGARLANARDRSSIYSALKDSSMTAEEREKFQAELKARFQPTACAVPATIQGLASLANERIEDAIARGQFKNLPRGREIERDYNASNPFIDTTEYLMNKMIQKQDIVPPWIEKQQELVAAAARFRGRLRNDWRRHAARSIASRGGSLAEQIRRAEAYAAAEEVVNPSRRKEERMHAVDGDGQMSQITLSGELKPSDSASSSSPVSDSQIQLSVTETSLDPSGNPASDSAEFCAEISVTASGSSIQASTPASPSTPSNTTASPNRSESPSTPSPSPITPPIPFRDPVWESAERAFHTLTITHLNTLTRSYNLMAPDLAKKPYFTLERELRSCYADVAPQLAAAIRERAAAPARVLDQSLGQRQGSGVMERFGGQSARVWDERRPRYGLREFWRDLFAKEVKG